MQWYGETGLIATGVGSLGFCIILCKRHGIWPKGNHKGCPDPMCHNTVLQTHEEVKKINKSFEDFKSDIYPQINNTAKSLERIAGYLDGLKEAKKNSML